MKTPRSEMTNEHAAPNSATTTEELIVQYLDGELHRKELESVLFGRLAQSEEARTMLHEHLVMRGAMRVSAEDERFTLSESLDMKTRARIEQALKFSESAPAVRTDAVSRRTTRWSLRPSLAVLALLLAVGTTWYVTRSTDTRMAANTPTVQSPVASSPVAQTPAQQNSEVHIAQAPKSVQTQSVIHVAMHHAVKSTAPAPEQSMAQNTAVAPKSEQKTEEPNPVDLMASKRFGRFLNASEKREIVVTSHDRL